ncbi:MAG: alpha-L-arabinofuranosidase C-terminal domain-containing protein [Prevotella sp.]
MNTSTKARIIAIIALFIITPASSQETCKVDILATKPGAKIPSTLYGHFFEDINFGADGGLYAEMIKNRSFEFPNHLGGWETFGNVSVKDDGPFEHCPHYVRLNYAGHKEKRTGLENNGFFGIGLKEGAKYRFSVWARGEKGRISVQFIDKSSDAMNQILVSEDISINTMEWQKYSAVITSPSTIDKATIRIFLRDGDNIDLEHISLFPEDTWKGRENGLRKDIAEALEETKPGVFRFPGGCIVEGTDLESRYKWKNTLGPVENRPYNENRWQFTFERRFFPDYYQSYGMGFYELFLLAEDIGAEPLPVLSCGLACQFQNQEESAHASVDSLQPFIQDALDLIEFANGDTLSTWGKLRATMGHPESFGLKFIAIGNEQWGKEYPVRLKPFIDAIHREYPEIKIVGSAGPSPDGEKFDSLWKEMANLKVDLVDEHFYKPEDWYIKAGKRYDGYSRKGPKVFAGEYACHGKNNSKNHYEAALMEAAFMTGIERNADIVEMATYAPLLAHVEGWQWCPDLIWFDNLRCVRTCSWYVQKLFSNNKGTRIVPALTNGKAINGDEGLYASAVWDEVSHCYILKVVNTSWSEKKLEIELKGISRKNSITEARATTFHSDDMNAENTLDKPSSIIPFDSEIKVDGNSIRHTINGKTFVVLYLHIS